MTQAPLYPLLFKPIYQYRLWGGRRLSHLLKAPLPADGSIGEAWILSDRDDFPSRVANGPLEGETIRQLLERWPDQMLGRLAGCFKRFPLLLKFLDVRNQLSVQVHPSDRQTDLIPAGEHGKTEAWVVLESEPDSRIYAGLKHGATANTLRCAIEGKKVADQLSYFTPKTGDGVLVKAGTVHSLENVVVFEVQENSDVTFRLYDWDHIDAKTGQPRPLQVDQAMACIDFSQGAICPVTPSLEIYAPVQKERLFCCKHFALWRTKGEVPFKVGAVETPRVLVCTAGDGQLEVNDNLCPIGKGDVLLLPAIVGACLCRPHGPMSVLEISLPERTSMP